jgi:hypothetical protein
MNAHEQAGEGMLPPGFLIVVSAQGEPSTHSPTSRGVCEGGRACAASGEWLAHCPRVCYREGVTRFGAVAKWQTQRT